MTEDKLLCGFDLETTGVNPQIARIVTANITLRDTDSGMEKTWNWLVDPGVEIPAGATAVHGVTTAQAQAEGWDAAKAVDTIADMLTVAYSDGAYIVVFNAAYDIPLLEAELKRYGLPSLAERIGAPVQRVYDPLVIDRAADPYRRGKRTLTAMCPVYGIEPSANAHDAAADVAMTLDLMEALLKTYNLPEMDKELYEFQREAHFDWAESFGKWLRRQGKTDDVSREWI